MPKPRVPEDEELLTGEELLKRLQALTPEELRLPIAASGHYGEANWYSNSKILEVRILRRGWDSRRQVDALVLSPPDLGPEPD